MTTTAPTVSVRAPTAPATELDEDDVVGRLALDGAVGEARVGGARAHRVPDVRVGGEQERHVVGDDRVAAVDRGRAAELASGGRRDVDDRARRPAHGRRARAPAPRMRRGCRRGSRGRCAASSGRSARPRARRRRGRCRRRAARAGRRAVPPARAGARVAATTGFGSGSFGGKQMAQRPSSKPWMHSSAKWNPSSRGSRSGAHETTRPRYALRSGWHSGARHASTSSVVSDRPTRPCRRRSPTAPPAAGPRRACAPPP